MNFDYFTYRKLPWMLRLNIESSLMHRWRELEQLNHFTYWFASGSGSSTWPERLSINRVHECIGAVSVEWFLVVSLGFFIHLGRSKTMNRVDLASLGSGKKFEFFSAITLNFLCHVLWKPRFFPRSQNVNIVECSLRNTDTEAAVEPAAQSRNQSRFVLKRISFSIA